MKRWMLFGATALLGASLLGSGAVAYAQQGTDSGGNPPASQGNTGGRHAGENQQQGHSFLRRIVGQVHRAVSSESFDQFLGLSYRVKDAEGKAVTIAAFPGIVQSATDTSVTLTLNDGSGDQTYTFTDPPPQLQRVLQELKAGDKAVVITVDGEPRLVVTPRPHQPRPSQQNVDKLRERLQDQINKLQEQQSKVGAQIKERVDKQVAALQERLDSLPADDPRRGRIQELIKRAQEFQSTAEARLKEQIEQRLKALRERLENLQGQGSPSGQQA